MSNIFKPKRSNTPSSVPTTSHLIDGEMAVNSADKKIYLRDGFEIVEIANYSSGSNEEDTKTELVSYASASDISNSALSISGISTYNQVGILTGSLANNSNDFFGWSVATSADGKTIVVGAIYDEIGAISGTGLAYVFDRVGNSFNQVGILTGFDNEFGFYSVDISADGKTIVVGAKANVGDYFFAGTIYVFDRVENTFNRVGILTGSLTKDHDQFGRFIDISADGKTIVAGVLQETTNDSNFAYVFDRVGNSFNQVGILTGSFATDIGDFFGYSVATSADGKTIIVGAISDEIGETTGTGVVYVFDRVNDSFNQVGILTGSLASSSDSFGSSVATSADGKTIIVGATSDEIGATTGTGVVYVFDRIGNSFNQVGILTGSLALQSFDQFGSSVATSADGKTIVVGAHLDEIGATTSTGIAYIFNRQGNIFNQVGILTGSFSSQTNDLFGFSVAISADGKTIIVGARNDEIGATTSTGIVYVFDEERETYVYSDASGNIGIGTAIPTAKLTVSGDVNITGIVTATKFVGDGSLLTNLGENINIAGQNIIYVAKDGNDANDGTLSRPKLTIKSAVESIGSGTTDIVVRVAPGTYIEDNPIILPDEVSVIGQSLRETTVIPQNDDQDLFYVSNGNYIAEMSFRGSLINKAVISFDPEKPRYITQSPYIQNCTNFIPDSIGLKVDGNAVIGPIKSMVLDSYTQYNQGGIGASITNQGYAQLVSLFTICDDIAIYCGNGGGCDLTNSNSSFGNYGLVADGVSPKKYSGIITSPSTSLSNTFVLNLSTPELSVSNAVYDNISGIVTITTSLDHNFNVGMGITIAGLGFTCSSGPGIVTYPSGNKGYTFNVNQVVSSNEFSAYVGVSTLQHTYVSGGTVKTEVVRPYDGQAIYFNDLYHTVKTIVITDGGSGYTSPPIVTIDAPSSSWGVRAKAIATVENGSVTQIDMLSNGRGYTTAPSVTFSAPQTGINTAIGAAVLTPEYYTINRSTEISNGISTITLNENVPFAVGIGTTVNFFKQSRILATGHSFEFIGSGTDIANSIPFNGGSPPIPENETDSRNGGLVVYTSTNQSGNFKIGDGITINQNTSSITGQAYEKSLVSTMTPYILSLGAL